MPGVGSSYSFQFSNGWASVPSARRSDGPVVEAPGCGPRSIRRRSRPGPAAVGRDGSGRLRIPSRPCVTGWTHGWLGSERSVQSTDAMSSPGSSSATYQPRASPGQPSQTRSRRPRKRSSQRLAAVGRGEHADVPVGALAIRAEPAGREDRPVRQRDGRGGRGGTLVDRRRPRVPERPRGDDLHRGLHVRRLSTIYNGARRAARSRRRLVIAGETRGHDQRRRRPPIHASAARRPSSTRPSLLLDLGRFEANIEPPVDAPSRPAARTGAPTPRATSRPGSPGARWTSGRSASPAPRSPRRRSWSMAASRASSSPTRSRRGSSSSAQPACRPAPRSWSAPTTRSTSTSRPRSATAAGVDIPMVVDINVGHGPDGGRSRARRPSSSPAASTARRASGSPGSWATRATP